MINKYTYELHCHTAESSGCAQVEAEEVYRLHESAGFDGIVVTDHFTHHNIRRFGENYADAVNGYLRGYEALKAVAREGFEVLLGLEFRFEDDTNDYLIFGITPELLRATTDLDLFSRKQLRGFADESGLLIVQAHPFRSVCHPDDPSFLDGVETYNGNPNHDSHNDEAAAFAEKYNLIQTSGSDFHEVCMLARGGIASDYPIRSEAELVEVLKSGGYQLMRA